MVKPFRMIGVPKPAGHDRPQRVDFAQWRASAKPSLSNSTVFSGTTGQEQPIGL
jgi:hypothetical protein